MALSMIISYLISLSLLTSLVILAALAAALLMRYFGRYILHKTNVNTRHIMPVQIGCLFLFAIFFTAGPIMVWKTWPQINTTVKKSGAMILRGTPEGMIAHYYSALNQGIVGDDFWDVYDLWSTKQQAQFSYDELRLALQGTQRIRVGDLKLISKTQDSAEIVAVVTAIVEADGMIKERTEKVDYNLTIEQGWWRVASFQVRKS